MRLTSKGLIALAACGILLASVVVASAETDRAGGRVDWQTFAWINEAVTTTTTEWRNIPGLAASTACGNSRTVATVSIDLATESSPVQIRVAMDNPIQRCPDCAQLDGLLAPRNASLDRTSSFRFVGETAPTGVTFHAQWRLDPDAPGNGTAALDAATLHVLWNVERATSKGAVC